MPATDRLTLRSWRADDAADVLAYVSDWALARMTASIPYPYTREMADAFVQREASANGAVAYAVDDAGGLVGSVGLKPLADKEGIWELGYWIGAGHQGKGYAREAAAATCAVGFRDHAVRSIHACVFDDNPASDRVLRKLGFRYLGPCEGASKARGGVYPTWTYQLDRADWEAER